MSMSLIRTATEADIPFIMETERMPGFEWVVSRSDEASHRREMGQAATSYLIGERDGVPFGFAILQNLDDPFGNVLLKRIVIQEPGRGLGRLLLRAVLAATFERPEPFRIWLTVAPHNERARHLYRSLGFEEEGVMREAYVNPVGQRVSSIMMSILRREWRTDPS